MSNNSTPHKATALRNPLLPLAPTLIFAELTKFQEILCQIAELTLRLNSLYEQASQLDLVTNDKELTQALTHLDKACEDAIAQGVNLESAYAVQGRDGTFYTLILTQLGVECRKVS